MTLRSGHKRKLVVLDYGSGNLRSAQRALERVGADVEVTADRSAALAAHGLVVPGVGAFEACMTGLRGIGGDEIIAERVAAGRPVLIGASRKGFIGRVLGGGPDDRRAGSLAAAVFSIQRGAHVLRVHDVKESCDAAKLMDKLRAQGTQDGLVT